jgi:hypothetical protein
MGSNVQGWISIDSCVKAYMDESEQSMHKYFKLWQLSFRCMEQLGLDFFYQVKTVKLPVNDNKTVTIPSDYINYTKIGILNNRGEVIPLSYNNKLTNYADLFSNRAEKTEDNTLFDMYSPQSPNFYNYWNGSAYGNLYGVPSGAPFVGSFKVDIQNNVILLNENFYYDYLMVEYIGSPEAKEGQDYYIPMQFREAMISYLAWKDIASIPSKTHVNNANVGMRRREFYNERRLANARFKPYYSQEAYNLSLEMTRLTVKA